jgi:ribonuclease HI
MLFDEPTQQTSKYSHLALFCDGGSRGNPGKSASGFVIYDLQSLNLNLSNTSYDQIISSQAKIVHQEGVYLGITTNNVAEWNSAILGLEFIVKNHPKCKSINVFMDSDLVVKQIKGIYKIKQPHLIPLGLRIKELQRHFQSFEISHIYREFNKLADQMVNECLDKVG